MKIIIKTLIFFILVCLWFPAAALSGSQAFGDRIYQPGELKPIDSILKVKPGDNAPDFALPGIDGKTIRLSDFKGVSNVMLTFIPAAWTPVCSDQWPGYNLAKPLFDQFHTEVIGISVDGIPTLFAWTREMGGLWFRVASDFWPHGAVSNSFGVLRSDGKAERAIFLIDKTGILRFIHVGDINVRPDLGMIVNKMKQLNF